MSEKQAPKIEFLSNHKPLLKDGEYSITVTQEIKHARIPTEFSPKKTINFHVSGEQYVLNPREINQVFPPAGSVADHSNVFPHIVLNRSTLPWERKNGSNIGNQPWLVLLLFTEDEKIKAEPSTLDKAGYTPNIEVGQSKEDKLMLLKVPEEVLNKIMPTAEELDFLAHVRQGKDNDGPVGNEKVVIIGNRLPKKGEMSTVHLVSIENCFKTGKEGIEFNWKEDKGNIQLVSLKSWKFSCPDHYKITQEALDRLAKTKKSTADLLQDLEGKEYYKKAAIEADFKNTLENYNDELLKNFHFGTFTNTLLHLNRNPNNLRLPDKSPEIDSYLRTGFVPVQHHFRKGAKSVSWYHGPLSTGMHKENRFNLPAKASDQLLLYNSDNGMFDTSYAAAWELGRLWGLENKRFSTELFKWKRKHTHRIRAAEQIAVHDSGHLPQNKPEGSSLKLPEFVQKGFDELSLLKGVPFNYLVPQEAMLPVESIRFFYINELWMDCLLDGAFSIGRASAADHDHDTIRKAEENGIKLNYPTRTGFIMRSDVISGWPDMVIEGYKNPTDSVTEAPMELHKTILSENVVLCIFEGEIDHVEMHLKPETIHFGLDVELDNEGNIAYTKRLRDDLGKPSTSEPLTIKPSDDKRIVDIKGLSDNMNSSDSAHFGYLMVKGIEKVIFEKPIG
jgi:hypothetical protein